VSNRIFITSTHTRAITSVQNENRDRTGFRVCMSGAVSGIRCGRLDIVSVAVRYLGKTVRSQRLARFTCRAGDSGSPVYYKSTAIGLVVASSTNPGRCYYTHIGHAQETLNLSIKTG
jgi:hypothetical protein